MNWYSPELTERIARSLGVALELRGFEPIGHTDRVIGLVERLAQELELNEEEVRDVRLGALLHDLGKFNLGFQAKGRPDLGAPAGQMHPRPTGG